MSLKNSQITASISICIFCLFYFLNSRGIEKQEGEYSKPQASGAWHAFQWWYAQRALPYEMIPIDGFEKAAKQKKQRVRKEESISGISLEPWISLGPTNIGGRVLALAVDPSDPDIVWAGSASGGLWKSTTGGEGSNAWTYINTNFNTLSVSALAIDPLNSNIIYIGTGEISLYHRALVGTPGARASYGMGILKSTDGGISWIQTALTWTFPEITAVQKIIVNPLNTQSLFAATSEGVFKSTDGGNSWIPTPTPFMAMDIIMSPVDTATLFSAHGNLNSSPAPGLYKSTNSGSTWTKLSGGLPTTNFGRTSLSISASAPSTIYAGIADAASSTTLGLYKSTDNGSTWNAVTTQNYVGSQGWYDNVIAVHPLNPDTIYCAGFDIHKSTDGGTNLPAISSGVVHVDHHAIAFHPSDPRIVYFGTDGGVYKTTNAGSSFTDCNGGFITTQFYPGFANSFTDTSLSIGGLQDNGTLKYSGSATWSQIFGADGGWCAIDPVDPDILYFEYQWLNLYKSTNGGYSASRITNGLPTGASNANFIPPFILSISNPQVLYAGGRNVYKSTTAGSIWFASNGESTINGTNIACIGLSYTNHDSVITATGTGALGIIPKFEVFTSANGGMSWKNVTYNLNGTDSLPDRYPTDIEFNPNNSSIAYLTFSGYGTSHVFMTENFGNTWTDITGNLPDIPHQAVVVDPESPENIYVGTDLGVFHSSSNGSVWEEFNTGMPPAMVLDVTISRNNGKLRASTFGNGLYERPLVRIPTIVLAVPNGGEIWAGGYKETITWSQKFLSLVRLEYSTDNGSSWNLIADSIPAVQGSYKWTLPPVSTTTGLVKISDTHSPAICDSSDGVFTVVFNPDFLTGWNLISVPYRISDPRSNTIYPNAVSSAFTFKGTYFAQESLRTGSGYWLKFNTPDSFGYAGDSLFTDTVEVFTGWNLIGTLTIPIGINDIIDEPTDIITSDIFGYRQGYYTADTLAPKYGYWVKVNKDGRLILSSGSPGHSIADEIPPETPPAENFIKIQDASGNKQKLYFTIERGSGRIKSELPPPPPFCVFDARFKDGYMIADLSNGEISLIYLTAENLPIMIEWHCVESSKKPFLQINDHSYILNSSGSISVGQKISSIALGASGGIYTNEPLVFSLEQNYPNPFNPVTTVSFAIGHTSFVSLRIFDILGKEVTTLVNEVKQPGEFSVQWNAENFPSGIYYYRIETENTSVTRKMILIK